MKNFFNKRRFATFSVVQKFGLRLVAGRLGRRPGALSLAAFGVVPHLVSQAQRHNVPSKVWNVAAQPSGGGTVVWITADAPLSRAQNWQDSEGYHLVLPNTVSVDSLKAARGVKVRRVGTSLEVLLQTKPGAKVSVQSDANELSLLVDKKLEPRDADAHPKTNASEKQLFEDPPQSKTMAPRYRSP